VDAGSDRVKMNARTASGASLAQHCSEWCLALRFNSVTNRNLEQLSNKVQQQQH
jgi:hypothetical protein